MIFPHIPKHYLWLQTAPELLNKLNTTYTKTPLRDEHSSNAVTQTTESKVDIQQWWIDHGLATDPAAVSTHSATGEPVDWLAKDAIEFYALCLAMIGWIVYWYGVHRGVW